MALQEELAHLTTEANRLKKLQAEKLSQHNQEALAAACRTSAEAGFGGIVYLVKPYWLALVKEKDWKVELLALAKEIGLKGKEQPAVAQLRTPISSGICVYWMGQRFFFIPQIFPTSL
jgi:N-acyl-L-homoserine lactone synthetase